MSAAARICRLAPVATFLLTVCTAFGEEPTARELLEKCLATQKRTDCISYTCSMRFARTPPGGMESRNGTDFHLKRQGKLADVDYTRITPPPRAAQPNRKSVSEGRYVISDDLYIGYPANPLPGRKSAGYFSNTALEEKRKHF